MESNSYNNSWLKILFFFLLILLIAGGISYVKKENNYEAYYKTNVIINDEVLGVTLGMDSLQVVYVMSGFPHRINEYGIIRTTHSFEHYDITWDYATLWCARTLHHIEMHKSCDNVETEMNKLVERFAEIYNVEFDADRSYKSFELYNVEQDVHFCLSREQDGLKLKIYTYSTLI